MLDLGKVTLCTARASLLSLMARSTRASSKKESDTVLALSCPSLEASKSRANTLYMSPIMLMIYARYEGAWVDDKRSGKGKLTLLSGEVYEGDFVENKKNGDGYVTAL